MITIPPDLAVEMEAEFRRGWHQGQVRAEIESKQAAPFNQQQHKSVDGLGFLRMRVPGDAYHFWGQKLGYDCWNDKTFLAEFERDNEACRVNSGGTKLQVGYGTGKEKTKSWNTGKIIIGAR